MVLNPNWLLEQLWPLLALPALSALVWFPLARWTNRRLADNISLGLSWLAVIAWDWALWALARRPEDQRVAKWLLSARALDMQLGLTMDALSALLGTIVALIAAAGQSLLAATREKSAPVLLPAASVASALVLLAGHPLLLWAGWAALSLLAFAVLWRSPRLPAIIATSVLSDIALAFALLRMLAPQGQLELVARSLLLAVAARLVLLTLCAARERQGFASMINVLAIACIGLLPSALYLLLRHPALWRDLHFLGQVMHWGGLACLLLLAGRTVLARDMWPMLCSLILFEIFIVLALLPGGVAGLLLYQVVLLLIAIAGLVPLAWLAFGEHVSATTEETRLAIAGFLLLSATLFGCPFFGGYYGRTALLLRAWNGGERLFVGGVLLGTLLIAIRLWRASLDRWATAEPDAQDEGAAESLAVMWIPLVALTVLAIAGGLFASDIVRWGAPLALPGQESSGEVVSPLADPRGLVPALIMALGLLWAWRGQRRQARWRVNGELASQQAATVRLELTPTSEQSLGGRLTAWAREWNVAAIPPEVVAALACILLVILMLWLR